jgi:hypothetical protein
LPDFYDLAWGTFTAYPDYLGEMSYAPETLSAYDDSGFRVTGSYRYSTVPFVLQFGVAGSALDSYMGINKAYVPRETRVRIDGNGSPVYDVTATPRQSGESKIAWTQLSQGSLDSMYQAFVGGGGYNIGDFFPYRVNGVQFYAAMFNTSATASNWMMYGRSASQALSDIAKLSVLTRPAVGWMHAAQVRRPIDDQLPEHARSETAQGYSLQRVQVYGALGAKFNAVSAKATGTCTAQ